VNQCNQYGLNNIARIIDVSALHPVSQIIFHYAIVSRPVKAFDSGGSV